MRKLFQVESVKRFSEQVSYIHSRILKSLIILTVFMVILHTYFFIINVSQQIFGAPYTAIYMGLTGFSSLIYTFIIVYLIYLFTVEFEEGYAYLYLSHPISKREFVSAWLFVSLGTTLVLYFLSLTLPVVVFDPTIIWRIFSIDILYMFLEYLSLGLITFLVSLKFRKKNIAFLTGIGLYYLLPFILLMLASLSYPIYRTPPYKTIPGIIFSILYPFKSRAIFMYMRYNPSFYPSLFLTIIVLALILYYSNRVEVV